MSSPIEKRALILAAVPVAAALVYGAFAARASETPPGPKAAAASPAAATTATDPVERGRYLVNAMGCDDCHSPKTMEGDVPVVDPSRRLAGHPDGGQLPPPPAPNGPWIASSTWDLTAWSGPWGISYAANLTPDENTGIGIWTEEMFVKAIRTGRHMGQSRPILPPMPWPMYKNLSDEDLEAIFAFLRTLPPVHNRVPEPVPPAGPETPATGL